MQSTNPFLGFLRTLWLFATWRVRFVRESIGRRKGNFTVFRHVIIQSRKPAPQAMFTIRFRPKDMGIEANKCFSRLPMMVFMGFGGFRSKLWMVDESTGECQGVYEWQTVKDAENYSRSIALRFMTRRSVSGSVKFDIASR